MQIPQNINANQGNPPPQEQEPDQENLMAGSIKINKIMIKTSYFV